MNLNDPSLHELYKDAYTRGWNDALKEAIKNKNGRYMNTTDWVSYSRLEKMLKDNI